MQEEQQKQAMEPVISTPEPEEQHFTVTGGPETLIEIKQKEVAADILFPERVVHPNANVKIPLVPQASTIDPESLARTSMESKKEIGGMTKIKSILVMLSVFVVGAIIFFLVKK